MSNPDVYLTLLVVIALPIAWFLSEFGPRRALRIGLGIAAIASSMGVAYVVSAVKDFEYDVNYGTTTRQLVDTTIAEIEDGNLDRVMAVLRRVQQEFGTRYAHHANYASYDALVQEAVAEMKSDRELTNTKWDTSPFTDATWMGHWEDDTGYWLFIEGHPHDLKIIRSGGGMPKMSDVMTSDDHRTLSFTEGGDIRHELTLQNKYEATPAIRDPVTGEVPPMKTLHKLIRATPQQRRFTQQSPDQ